jgi:hypothetical protein
MHAQYRGDGIVGGLRRWHATISSWAGLGTAPRDARQRLPAAAEPLREAMRSLLRDSGVARTARLAYAIEASRDVASLWHLRSTLMQALAGSIGERAARDRITGLDAMFLQVWPKAPVTRA